MSFVPQPLLLESADLIVTHGGFGSVVEAIRTGTPIVLLPMFSDQPHNEARTARLTSASNSTSSPSRRRPSPRPAHGGAGRPLPPPCCGDVRQSRACPGFDVLTDDLAALV
jgi:hypothetical protein